MFMASVTRWLNIFALRSLYSWATEKNSASSSSYIKFASSSAEMLDIRLYPTDDMVHLVYKLNLENLCNLIFIQKSITSITTFTFNLNIS